MKHPCRSSRRQSAHLDSCAKSAFSRHFSYAQLAAANRRNKYAFRETPFNWRRFWAIVGKEFIQMRRDRLTFGMMVGIPMLQLVSVRLRHQFRPQTPAHGRLFGRQQRFFPHHRLGSAQQQLFRHRPRTEERGGHSENARPGHGPVRRGHSGGFLPQTAARRKAGFAARSRRDRSVGHRLRRRRGEFADHHGVGPRPDRAAGEIARRAAAVQSGGASTVQSGKHHPVQHRARPHGRDADHDDDHHHRAGHHARTRTRHHGKSALHAGAAGRSDRSAKSCLTSRSVTSRFF